MLFNSLSFLVFFPIVLLIYFIIPRKLRYIWLLLASYYFYMCWNVKYVLLLFGSTAITYASALVMDKFRDNAGIKKIAVGFSLILNLAILAVFKYANFAIETINKISGKLGGRYEISAIDILLPMGISFYIFQAVGYTVDVYRKKIPAEKNFFRYALFVSFFPQLVAGPIERSTSFMPQIKNVEKINLWDTKRIQSGAVIMLYGYFLKMIIADRASIFVDTVFNPGTYTDYKGITLWVAAILFSIQIYCDFAGYTYIAIGTAKICGFELMNNFNMPYLSVNIKDFWDRWHISLSSWFRDYLYFPLGGSKKGRVRKYINIFIVFCVSGLWHGASWHFVLWGMVHGIMRIVGELTGSIREKVYSFLNLRRDTLATKLAQTIITFVLVTFAWVIFRALSIRQAMDMILGMFKDFNPWVLFDKSLYALGLDEKDFHVLMLAVLFMLIIDILRYKKVRLVKIFMEQNLWFRWLVFHVGIIAILIFGIYGAKYDAAQFIYFQF